MLGRRLLTRLTRLGLATYAMTWCMALTVCASENPIADMAVAGAVTELAHESETEVERTELPVLTQDEFGEAVSVETELSENAGSDIGDITSDGDDLIQKEEDANLKAAMIIPDLEVSPNNITVFDKFEYDTGLTFQFTLPDNINNITESDMSYFLTTDPTAVNGTLECKNMKAVVDYNEAKVTVKILDVQETTTVYLVGSGAKREETETESGNWELVEKLRAVAKIVIYVPADLVSFWADETGPGNDGLPRNINDILINKTEDNDHFKIMLYNAGNLNESKISWELSENSVIVDQAKRGITMDVSDPTVAHFNISNMTKSGVFNIKTLYNNSFYDSEDALVVRDASVCNWLVRINVSNHGTSGYTTVAHLPKKSAKVEIYKKQNTVPISMRYAEDKVNERVEWDGKIVSVKVADKKAAELIDAVLVNETDPQDIQYISLSATDKLLDNPKLIKKSVSTPIEVGYIVPSDGSIQYVNTTKLSITKGTSLPKITTDDKLEFNSYNEFEVQNCTLNGAVIDFAKPYDAKAGLFIPMPAISNNTVSVMSATGLPASVKKGKYKIKVFVSSEDPEWNIPSKKNGFDVTVPYTVRNGAPKLSLNATEATVNVMLGDVYGVGFSIANADDVMLNNSMMRYDVTNAKGKTVTGAFDVTIVRDGYTGMVYLLNNNAVPGQTYNLKLWLENEISERKSAVQTLKISTPKKDEKKPLKNVSIKGKMTGGIDANKPGSQQVIALTGKNINLFGRTPAINITYTNGSAMDLLTYEYDMFNGKLSIFETENFTLHDHDLGSTKYKVAVSYKVKGSEIKNTFTGTIKESKIEAKTDSAKINMNPFHENNVTIPITNLVGGGYDYNVVITGAGSVMNITIPGNGTQQRTPLMYAGHYVEDGRDVIFIKAFNEYLDELWGKTATVKITPVLPSGHSGKLDAKTTTVKITVVNPKADKTALSVSGKTNGKIDAVRDSTSAVVTLSFKNANNIDDILQGINCTYIYKEKKIKKGKTIPLTIPESAFNITVNDKTVIFKRASGSDLETGTYKAEIVANVKDAWNNTLKYPCTVSFRVVRGKTQVNLKPNGASIVNRNGNRQAKFTVTSKDKKLNKIENVTIKESKMAKKYNITFNPDTNTVTVKYADPNYVETSLVKKVRKFLLKILTDKITLQVKYEGSTGYTEKKTKIKVLP